MCCLFAKIYSSKILEAVLGSTGELFAGWLERLAGGYCEVMHEIALGVRAEHSRDGGRRGDALIELIHMMLISRGRSIFHCL